MTDPLTAFIDHMHASDCAPDSSAAIIADDKMHRFRLAGDKPKTQNGSYILRVDPDGFGVGGVMNFRDQVWHKWHTKSSRKATDEERAAWRKRTNDAKAAQERERKQEADEAAIKAADIWGNADRAGTNAYLDRKGFTAEALGCRMSRGSAVVPMWSGGKIVGLQFIDDDGDKLFLKSSAKDGAYHAIKGTGDLLVIGEGLATMGAISKALGCSVVVAFDAGNLKPVAKAMRLKYPDKKIVIAADGDQWTIPGGKRPDGFDNPAGDDPRWAEWRAAGLCANTGADKSAQAAVAIGGAMVLAPPIPANDAAKRTDWWDYWHTEGEGAVRACFEAAMREPEPEDMGDNWEPDYDAMAGGMDEPRNDDTLAQIRPLGYNRGVYYFFPKTTGQIESMTATDMNRMPNLQKLAPYEFWMRHYNPDGKTATSKVSEFATANLMDACHRAGIFQQEHVRGVGAWIDAGKPIVNCGNSIVKMDGTSKHPAEFKGEYVYESGPNLFDINSDPLANADAVKLLNICKSVTWKKSQYAYMLAGWLVVAPVGSSLPWRPHIWVTGRAESGKSTVMQQIIKPLLGQVSINVDSVTTEAGVRADIGTSGRPVVMDEAEAESKKQQGSIESIILLARLASSGGVIRNAYKSFQIRNCFCFSAIIARVENTADKGRISMLELMRDEHPQRSDRFAALMNEIHNTLTPEYSKAMLARTIENLPTLLKNIAVFSRAASDIFGNKRSGDQIGPMLAGAFMLTTTKEVTMEDATSWISKQNWDWHTATYDDSDASKLITYIMTARVRYDHLGMNREATVGDLVSKANDKLDEQRFTADKALRSYGLRVKDGMLMIANQAPQLRRLLSDTPYVPWARTLGDYPSADNLENKAMYFMAGLTSKAIAIPVDDVLGREVEDTHEEDLPFEMEDFAP